jgi:hypothetical protein
LQAALLSPLPSGACRRPLTPLAPPPHPPPLRPDRITLPRAAAAAAAANNKPGDWLYCLELLESTGIVVVPGSGFGQAEGSLHFRTTFLPPEEDIQGVVERLAEFHAAFLARHGGLGGGANGAAAAAAAPAAPAGPALARA